MRNPERSRNEAGPVGMPGVIDHHGAVTRSLGVPYFHNIETSVAKVQRGRTREPAPRGRVQHGHADPYSLRRARNGTVSGGESKSAVRSSTRAQNPPGSGGQSHCNQKCCQRDGPPSPCHCIRFHRATVSRRNG